MNTKLTPGVILLAILLGALVGPATTLRNVSSANLQDASYWWDLAAATMSSLASTILTIVGVVAASLGLPILKGGGADAADNP